MNFAKTIILVIILAVMVGALIVFVPRFLNQTKSAPTISNITTNNTPKETPIPTKPPVKINQSSDLKEEINKIEIPDFSKDFTDLKAELN